MSRRDNASFDCRRAVNLLSEAVAEYRQDNNLRDFVWTQKSLVATADDHKVADFSAKRRQSEGSGKSNIDRIN